MRFYVMKFEDNKMNNFIVHFQCFICIIFDIIKGKVFKCLGYKCYQKFLLSIYVTKVFHKIKNKKYVTLSMVKYFFFNLTKF